MIGTNVSSIGSGAFESCSGLTNVTVPWGITRLGAGVFNDCSSLSTIVLHSSLTNIASGLWGVESLDVGILSTGVVQVAGNTPRLTAITVVPQNLYYSSTNGILFNKPETILLEAPEGITGNYVILNGVTNIGAGAFSACTNLTGLIIPKSVTGIGASALDGCSGLTNVVVGTNVTSVGDYAFYFCSSLTTLALPAKVTQIGNWVFANCSGLTNFMIGTNVTSIGDHAFYSCSSLTTVAIPASVTNIGNVTFAFCGNLTNLTVDARNPAYSSVNGILFDKQQTRLIQVPGGFAGNYTVPNSVTNISYSAFYGCTNLSNVTLGTNVASVGSGAFAYCDNLKSLFFKGNAPVVTNYNFAGPVPAIPLPPLRIGGPRFPLEIYPPVVYYLPGTQGWGATFEGISTAPWDLKVQASGAGFGVRNNQFGFNITGSSNVVIVVEACTNLLQPQWAPVQTNVLNGGGTYFSDPEWTNYPGRYYRFRSE